MWSIFVTQLKLQGSAQHMYHVQFIGPIYWDCTVWLVQISVPSPTYHIWNKCECIFFQNQHLPSQMILNGHTFLQPHYKVFCLPSRVQAVITTKMVNAIFLFMVLEFDAQQSYMSKYKSQYGHCYALRREVRELQLEAHIDSPQQLNVKLFEKTL